MSDEFFPRNKLHPRFFRADNEIVDVFGPKLKPHAFAVYLVLARFANNNTGECRVPISKIATQLGMSKGGVFNALRRIVGLGLAKKIDSGDNRRCGTYVLADVKRLTGVHPVNLESTQRPPHERSVRPVYSNVHLMNAAFIPRTRNKESNTVLQDLQDSSSRDPICSKCQNSGSYPLPGHPGESAFCGCTAAESLRRREMGAARLPAIKTKGPKERLT